MGCCGRETGGTVSDLDKATDELNARITAIEAKLRTSGRYNAPASVALNIQGDRLSWVKVYNSAGVPWHLIINYAGKDTYTFVTSASREHRISAAGQLRNLRDEMENSVAREGQRVADAHRVLAQLEKEL